MRLVSTFLRMPGAYRAMLVRALALVLLVRDLRALAPLDHALLTAAGAGFVLYAALVGGYFVVRHILDTPPEAAAPEKAADPAPAAEATPEPSPEEPAEPIAA